LDTPASQSLRRVHHQLLTLVVVVVEAAAEQWMDGVPLTAAKAAAVPGPASQLTTWRRVAQ